MSTADLVRVLDEIGRLLEFQGENPFKIRAYDRAARTLEGLDEPLESVVAEGRLLELPGIGKAIAEKIESWLETGSIPLHDRLAAEIPLGVLDLLAVPGLGPKRARAVHETLGVASLDDLEAAARSGRLARVPGFGERTAAAMVERIERVRAYAGRFLGAEAGERAGPLLAGLEAHPAVLRAAIAGGLRRRSETVHDIDLLAASDSPAAVLDAFVGDPAVAAVLARGDTKATVRLGSGIPADLRVVAPEAWPFALQYLTGSQAHNTRLRGHARARGLTLNEYGLAAIDGGAPVACSTEADLYAALGLAPIPPELREDRGEIEAAATGTLPALVEPGDLAGVVHVHTDWSDGRASIEAMAEAARKLGYGYLVVCDHSQAAAYAGGLTPEDLARQREAIDAVDRALDGFRVLAGCEVDILPDGGLDLPDATLAGLDLVVASVHTHFHLSLADQTARVERALAHPAVDILGHPTGRRLLARDGAALDLERVLDAAAEHGVAVEINAHPRRLDLDWRWHRAAVERGVRLAIDPDAHDPEAIAHLDHGVGIARKGGLAADDVLTTLPVDEFVAALRRNRRERA